MKTLKTYKIGQDLWEIKDYNYTKNNGITENYLLLFKNDKEFFNGVMRITYDNYDEIYKDILGTYRVKVFK